MSGETQGASGTQAAPGTQPQAGDAQAQAAGTRASQAGEASQESENLDPVALARELRETRAEAAKYRREARSLTEAAQAAENAKLPEQERKDRRLAELEAAQKGWDRERKDWRTEKAVVQTAVRLGYRDPGDAYALLDRDALEFDENGNPTNVEKLLEALAETKAYLTGAPGRGSFDQGRQGTARSGQTMDDLLRGATGH